MDFETFCHDHQVEVSARQIPARSSGDWDTKPEPIHFYVTLTIKGKPLWSGEYSQGIGIAEAWAKKNKSRFLFDYRIREMLTAGPGRGKRWHPDSEYWTKIRETYGKAVERGGVLSAAEILNCLQLDASNSDQPFGEWAADFGYSDDSIKAKKIWETCNDLRRTLRDNLGQLYPQFMELEEA